MRKFIFLIFTLVLIVYAPSVSAHNPRLVFQQATGTVTTIENVDLSQAFYGLLKGEADIYTFKLDNSTDFYYSLLAPDLKDAKTNYTARLSGRDINNKEVWQVLVQSGEWPKYYEEFAGDNYRKGPEKTIHLLAGDYQIKVGNPTNTGKYVLEVGKKETWSIKEFANTIQSLPVLKKDFFEKSAWTSFNNKIGVYLLVAILVLLIFFILMTYYFGRKFWLSFLIAFFVAAGLVWIRLYVKSPDNIWLCQNGEWVAQGKPETTRPDRSCAGQTLDTKGEKFQPAPAVVYLVRDFLQKNISNLSPEKEVLGGKFYLTNLDFRDNQTAVVSFEDGHNAYVAVFRFTIDEMEQVQNLGFDIVSKN